MSTFSIDLGSGKRPRGDLGVTLPAGNATVDVTELIDPDLSAWGWPVKKGTRVLEANIEDKATWELIKEAIDLDEKPRFLLSHVLEHVKEPWTLLTHIWDQDPVDVTIVVPNASVSKADWVDPQHRYSWTGGSLMNLVREFGTVRKMGWFGPALDLAVQYAP